jgi:thioredoxin-like negative regulator of GroEL
MEDNNLDLGAKLFKTIQGHLENDDITKALKAMRELSAEAKSRHGLDRPAIRLQAAKALVDIHARMAELEIKANQKPDTHIVNIYSTLPESKEDDDIIRISQRLNDGLSEHVKR